MSYGIIYEKLWVYHVTSHTFLGKAFDFLLPIRTKTIKIRHLGFCWGKNTWYRVLLRRKIAQNYGSWQLQEHIPCSVLKILAWLEWAGRGGGSSRWSSPAPWWRRASPHPRSCSPETRSLSPRTLPRCSCGWWHPGIVGDYRWLRESLDKEIIGDNIIN